MIDVSSDFRKRRSQFHLMSEILENALSNATKTHIMCRANLSATMTKEYIEMLQQLGLLDSSMRDGKIVYNTNEKGEVYLQSYRRILQLLLDKNIPSIQLSIKTNSGTYWVEKPHPISHSK